jgi:NADP-dependent 3-hydroxy acid dehydrogenase YdfG
MSSVNGKVVLITGGANGIGAEVARGLHDKGAKLVLTDLDEIPLKDVATRLGESTTLKSVPELMPKMDAEVAALGRSMSARTDALEKH